MHVFPGQDVERYSKERGRGDEACGCMLLGLTDPQVNPDD